VRLWESEEKKTQLYFAHGRVVDGVHQTSDLGRVLESSREYGEWSGSVGPEGDILVKHGGYRSTLP
jgi:hypothetical protein